MLHAYVKHFFFIYIYIQVLQGKQDNLTKKLDTFDSIITGNSMERSWIHCGHNKLAFSNHRDQFGPERVISVKELYKNGNYVGLLLRK